MRAAVLTASGTNPGCADFPDPEPLGDRPLLTMVGAGMHPVVRSIATGTHYGSVDRYPLIPGVDGVAQRPDGTLVYTGYTRAPWGTMAERLATPFDIPLPPDADPLALAAGLNPAMSGFMPLVTHSERHGSLGTVLILGATGIAGQAAAQAALALGAEQVIGVGRDPRAIEELRGFGAEPVSIAGPPDALMIAIEQSTPSLVLDYAWGSVAESVFAALARRGMDDDDADISYVQIGGSAGPEAAVPASLLRSRRITISGSGAGSMSSEEIFAQLPRLMRHLADGTIHVPYTPYPLEHIDGAWAHTGRTRAVVTP